MDERRLIGCQACYASREDKARIESEHQQRCY
jgi:hypothetical protein